MPVPPTTSTISRISSTRSTQGNFPAVSFLKAPAYQDGHAGYSDPLDEQTLRRQTRQLPGTAAELESTAVVIMYDDSDGWYDHQMGPIVNQSTGPADALTGPVPAARRPIHCPASTAQCRTRWAVAAMARDCPCWSFRRGRKKISSTTP